MNLTVALTGASGAIFGRELLRTLEAMYGLPGIGAQQVHALKAGIDDRFIWDVFDKAK